MASIETTAVQSKELNDMSQHSHEDVNKDALTDAPSTEDAEREKRALEQEEDSFKHRLNAAEEDYINGMTDGFGLLE